MCRCLSDRLGNVTALYRRYRPETFQEVIGQAHVTDPLRHALVAERTHHAYLFSGPRGCGKTTSARILARCLNCAEGPTDTPCGTCPSCVELSRDGGGSLDVVEIDAASHNGVDDARELRERAVFAPARDRYKIYILDEAHMVTQQGFNALLKIVEEPPEHVKFIFATTEPDKVLTTIRSRTHHYPFRLVAPSELLGYLEQVAGSEEITVEDGVMALVVRSGGGSVRDSLSLLDQLIAGSEDKTITRDSTQALLGYTPRVVLDDIMSALASSDAPAAFHALDSVMQSGQDPRRFTEDLLAHLRDVIVIQATGPDARELFPGVSDGDLRMWVDQASWFSPQHLAQMGEHVSETLQHMSGVTAPRLQLELMLARLLSSPAQSSRAQPTAAQSSQAEAPAPTPENASSGQVAPPAELDLQEAPETESVEAISHWTLAELESRWKAIVDSVGEQKRSLWVALSETKPVGLDGDVVAIGFAKRLDAEILKKPQGPGSPLPNADLLREAIYSHTGHRVRFTVAELEAENSVEGDSKPESQWPVVSKPGSDEGESHQDSSGEESEHDDEPRQESSPGPQLATRGEPVIRQVLGGELIAEEILDEMSEQGEVDV